MQPRYSYANDAMNRSSVWFIEKWLRALRADPDFVPDMGRIRNLDMLNDFDRYDYSVWDDPIDFGLTIRMVAVNRVEELEEKDIE